MRQQSNPRFISARSADAKDSASRTARRGDELRRLLSIPFSRRGSDWLREALQYAIALELATVPPYLTALWTLKRTAATSAARERLLAIALDEMAHMGLACNLLAGLGGTPVIADPGVVPRYPGELPFHIKPDLEISLQRYSYSALNIFMRIEEPYEGDLCWHQGQSYPTIGLFYQAIYDAIESSSELIFDTSLQLEDPDIHLVKISSQFEALQVVQRIRDEGEGTTTSPIPDPTTGDFAHYFQFGELYHQGQLVDDGTGGWMYDPVNCPLPAAPIDDIYQMAPIPHGGYPDVSLDFDSTYSRMLKLLQSAWDQKSQDILLESIGAMYELQVLAVVLMETPLPGKSTETYGPSFLFYEDCSS